MGRTTPLRREIKRAFIPYLAAKGFSVDMRHAPQFLTFRRVDADCLHVCDIQWEKYGRARFVVNFAKCGAQGVMLRGEHIPPQEVFPFHGIERGRLCPGAGGTTRSWFRQDRPLLERFSRWSRFRSPQEVVSELIALFSEVEEFWISRRIGPHVRLMPGPANLDLTNFGDDRS